MRKQRRGGSRRKEEAYFTAKRVKGCEEAEEGEGGEKKRPTLQQNELGTS